MRDELRLRKLDHRKLNIGNRVRAGFRHHKLPLSAVSELDGLHLHLYMRRSDFWDHLLPVLGSSGRQRCKPGLREHLLAHDLYPERINKSVQRDLRHAIRDPDYQPRVAGRVHLLGLLVS